MFYHCINLMILTVSIFIVLFPYCVAKVLILMDKLISSSDKGETVIGIFLDFSKAFDTVDHEILLQKLFCYGRIESTKTTSMEDVSTGVLGKNREYSRSKDKAENHMMYQDIYSCICQNTKKNEDILSSMSNLQPNRCLKTCRRQVVNPRHQTSQGQSVANPETPL